MQMCHPNGTYTTYGAETVHCSCAFRRSVAAPYIKYMTCPAGMHRRHVSTCRMALARAGAAHHAPVARWYAATAAPYGA
jgi:hypothetical protein